jgi:hypothetical protein
MKFYAGIGSRETPPSVLQYMTQIAARLEDRGYVLRSGGARGADSAFEAGVRLIANKRIYVPWAGFNGRRGENVIECGTDPSMRRIAALTHPAWWRCSDAARKMHTRNVAQVLGCPPEDNADSEFVVCWTPRALRSGGTGQALRIAQRHRVQVFDLADAGRAAAFEAHVAAMAEPVAC